MLIVYLFILIFVIVNGNYSQNLVGLIQIFRHGERLPLQFFPNYQYKSYWKDLEPGELTNVGRRQLYSLGQFTRKRYGDWIPTKYSKNFIFAQTTDIDRAHISGQSYLYGLFPAVDDQQWLLNHSDWQPIPLHPSDPKVVWINASVCPAFSGTYREVKDINNINEFNADLYAYLREHTGDNVTDLLSAKSVWDVLVIEEGANLPLPEWSKSVYPEPLISVAIQWINALTYTKKLLRFFVAPLLNEWLNILESIAANPSSIPKFRVYSAHDHNLVPILKAFGAFNKPFFPEFASTIWIELRNTNNTFYVNIWMKNGQKINQIKIMDCELDCPLNEFRQSFRDILIDIKTWTEMCNSGNVHAELVSV